MIIKIELDGADVQNIVMAEIRKRFEYLLVGKVDCHLDIHRVSPVVPAMTISVEVKRNAPDARG